MKNFDSFGIMLDCSRNAVMKPQSLKTFIDIISKMGYNSLMLYTEDTYEISSEPYFGYLRGRYTKAELKEMDAYAKSKNIELIPCIQTLAHLNAIVRWPQYSSIVDCNDILLAGDEKTYELIDKMFNSLAESFTSRNINIGMDEAHMVGLGKYLDKNGFQNRFDIILKHLTRVSEIAKKYGFKPMMWSDMFFRLANSGNYYVEKEGLKISDEVKNLVPENVSLVYWDYYSGDKAHYDNNIKAHNQFNNDIWFAGGAWTWTGFTPHNTQSIINTKAALESCIKHGIRNAFLTLWGDNGKECSFYSVLPTLMYAAEIAKGNTKLKDIKAKFEKIVGIPFDKFMYLDLPDKLDDENKSIVNPSKYMLYNDLFLGIFDYTVKEGAENLYKQYSLKLKRVGKGTEFEYIFKNAAALCDCLYLKYNLGVKTREAYKNKDTDALKELIPVYKKFLVKLDVFYKTFKELWFKENKAFGFEVQDARLGGLLQRTRNCLDTLNKFIDGKIEKIEELEEELFSERDKGKEITFNNYLLNVTTSVM